MGDKGRITMIDTLRGVLIILVVAYHVFFDLNDIFGVRISFMYTYGMNLFRDCFVGLLIVVAGISCNLTRSNIKRGLKTLFLGMVITSVTLLIMPDQRVLFGILHFMGTSMLLWGLCEKFFVKVPAPAGIVFSLIGYVVTLSFYDLKNMYNNFLFFVLGFRTDIFSADYYPVFPWIFLFLIGGFLGRNIRKRKLPDLVYQDVCPFLSLIGRHTLLIYIVHQPLVYGLLWMVFRII